MEHSIISYQFNYYKIKRELCESNDEFYFRSWYIAKKKPNNKQQLDLVITESEIKSSEEFLKLTFTS